MVEFISLINIIIYITVCVLMFCIFSISFDFNTLTINHIKTYNCL